MNPRRRLLLLAGASALAGPIGLGAQPARKAARFRIGYLTSADPQTNNPNFDAFKQGLRDLGWVEGEKIAFEYRAAEGKVERFPVLAAEFVRLNVDVIVVSGTPAIRAAQQATKTIPIVMAALLIDPVDAGFVTSFARPGGNTTGLASDYEQIVTKQIQLLSEAVPGLSRLVVLRHATAGAVTERAAVRAAEALRLKTHVLTLADPVEFEAAFKTGRDGGAGAVLVLPSPILNAQRRLLIQLAARYRLPACYEFKEFVLAGGLMSYGPSIQDMFRRAASYVDRILKGAKPGDLPIERPDKFELVINLETARVLGLKMSDSLLTRADRLVR